MTVRRDPHLMGARVRGVAVTVAAILLPTTTALLLILGASPVAQAAPLSGTISTNTTWTLSGSPYSVSSLAIAAGVTLTIDPGVIVKFGSSQSSGLTVYGTVLAGSIPGEPVYFTSLKDDAAGGDTNGDGAATSPARGDWSGIVVPAGGTASLQNSVLRYGGYGGSGGTSAMVKIQGGFATVSGCSITESAVHGVCRLAGSLTVGDTTIQGIPSYPALSAPGVGLTITGCHLTGEGSYGLYAQGSATLTGNTISPKTRFDISAAAATLALNNNTFSGAVPFEFSLTDASVSLQGSGNTFTGGSAIRLTGTLNYDTSLPAPASLGATAYDIIWLAVNAGKTLTLAPGTVMKFSSPTAYLRAYGTLTAAGSPENPICFTSIKDDAAGGDSNGDGSATSPARGNWSGLIIPAGGTANLDSCNLRYGGYGGTGGTTALVKVEGGSVTMNRCSVTDSPQTGVRHTSGGLSLTDTAVERIAGAALVSYAPDGSVATGCRLLSESAYGCMFTGSATLTGNFVNKPYFSSSARRVVRLDGNTIAGPMQLSFTDSSVDLQGSNNTFTGPSHIQLSGTLAYDTSLPSPASLGATAYNVIWLTLNSASPAKTLTLAPGTVMKFNSPTAYLSIYGVLQAVGTPDQPIIFTSIKDDTAGGDSNGDGSATLPAKGDWSGIIVQPGAAATFDHCALAPPEVTLNVPPTFEVMLAMAAEVTSEVAIDRVEFYWDHDEEATLLGTVEEAPYCFSWKPTVQLEAADYEPSAFGDRVVRAVAYDLRGRGGSHTQLTTQGPALHLPVAADAQGVPKVIYRYFDLDPDVGEIIDWRGGQVTYDGHTGTDYDWPPQSEVRASRGGTVKEVRNDADDEPDPG